ncbi:hypothetical protein [Halobacillus andaensis]|uniref:hypothetical protein n=1 Tax=Halobacillus andaensis TaxID=1176239 RepID=UPI003D714001
MKTDFDVIVVGGGPAGLYASTVLQKGIPTQNKSEELRVGLFDQGNLGGLAKFGYITFSKRWSFSGSKIISALYKEIVEAGVNIHDNTPITSVKYDEINDVVNVSSNDNVFTSKYVIITSGIFPNPEAMVHKNILLGLHTPEKMLKDIKRKDWKSVLIYGSDNNAINQLKQNLASLDKSIEYGTKLQNIHVESNYWEQGKHKLPGIDKSTFEKWDGLLIDYNAYKVINGTTSLIELDKAVETEQGYILTNHFGKTNCERIYAAGNVTNVISGVLIALSSALTAALTVGRLFNDRVISEPTGRFPWFPREFSWEESWLPYLEDHEELTSFSNTGEYKKRKASTLK